jgi:hypothetical protein
MRVESVDENVDVDETAGISTGVGRGMLVCENVLVR